MHLLYNPLHPRQDNPPSPSPTPAPTTPSKSGSGMSGWGIFFLVFFILFFVGYGGYILFIHLRARRLGLPSPTWRSFIAFPNSERHSSASRPSTGILGFVKSKLPGRRGGSGGAALGGGSTGYTGAAERSRATRAHFGQLRQEDDEAWDARGYRGYDIDHDTELNDRGRGGGAYEGYNSGPPGGLRPGANQQYGAQDLDEDGEPRRGRSRSREPPSYQPVNPRIEQVRNMSPRPTSGESFGVVSVKGGRGSLDGERRSIFREDMS